MVCDAVLRYLEVVVQIVETTHEVA
jgi:hypothetical protein